MPTPTITFDQFLAVDIRIGTVVAAEPFPRGAQARAQTRDRFRPRDRAQEELGANHPALQARRSHRPPSLRRRQLPAAPNRPVHVGSPDARLPRQDGYVVLINADNPVPNGARLL